jgi:enoyl-CoA hydratase/carnithine racemase
MARIEYEEKEGIGYITLNRPEVLNALTDDMIKELKEVLFQFDDDPNAMVAILSGKGRAFCSGADVKQRQLRPMEEMLRIGSPQGRDSHLDTVLYRFTNWKPMIAAVHGYVMGAGLYLSMISELIVAEKGTKFQITETGRGWSATNFVALLQQRAPGGFSNDVMLTGRFWDAEEGFRNNAVDRLAEPGKRLEVARDVALNEIMINPPLATRAIVETRRGVLEEVELKARLQQNKRLHLSEDFRESAMAFVEKRKPEFKGR